MSLRWDCSSLDMAAYWATVSVVRCVSEHLFTSADQVTRLLVQRVAIRDVAVAISSLMSF